MKRYMILFFIILSILVLVFFWTKTQKEKSWELYANKELGIAFSHPKKIGNSEMVFFQVGNVLFVTTTDTKLYLIRNEIDPKKYTDPVEIIKQANFLAGGGSDQFFVNKTWAIIVDKVHTKDDINKIIDKNINRGLQKCELTKIQPSKIDGVEDISYSSKIQSSSPLNSDCQTNFMARFKYSQKYGKTAYWIIGQENMFDLEGCKEGEDTCNVDTRMADTFYFFN